MISHRGYSPVPRSSSEIFDLARRTRMLSSLSVSPLVRYVSRIGSSQARWALPTLSAIGPSLRPGRVGGLGAGAGGS
jgi:hypothetical protein